MRDEYEIRWEDIRILEVIGEGAFGRVMKAQLLTGPMTMSDDFVAVKMTRGTRPFKLLFYTNVYCDFNKNR